MADVVTKCVNANSVNNGAAMVMSDAGKNATNSFHRTEDGLNEDINKLDARWTNRLDDKTYYTT